jgi:hypothetical protein
MKFTDDAASALFASLSPAEFKTVEPSGEELEWVPVAFGEPPVAVFVTVPGFF